LDGWLSYARSARLHAAADEYARAEADYARAAERGAGGALFDWYRHSARTCALLGRDSTAVWYLDRLVSDRPDEWEVYAERAEVYGRLGKVTEKTRDEARAVAAGADPDYLAHLADDRAAAGRWPEAAELCAKAAAGEPPDVTACYREGLARLRADDRGG